MLKSLKLTLNLTQTRQKTQKAQKDKITSFPKELLENTDFYKSILNKIMTTLEQCSKYNFVALLREI